MQRKPGFPVANCSIKMPDNMSPVAQESLHCEEDVEQQQRRQQLINFGHSQWGFNNWNWTVTKQELDFVDLMNGKYCAGVVAFVSVSVKNFDIHRENIGYATSIATNKGFAIYKSRKCAVTNALRETLLSFGGNVAAELMEYLEAHKPDVPVPAPVATAPVPTAPAPVVAAPAPAPHDENNQNAINKAEPKNSPLNRALRKDDPANMRSPHPALKPVANPPPVARAQPMPAPPAPRLAAPRPPAPPAAPAPAPAPAAIRPNSNVSFVLQPVMPPLYPPRLAPPVAQHVFPNYYEYPWHFAYEPHHGNVNLNFNVPPKNLVVNSRAGSVECRSACREGEPVQYAPQQGPGCWIKPTIFYDGFWTEQKVKKWVAEQVEKQFPDEPHKAPSPAAAVAGPDAPKA